VNQLEKSEVNELIPLHITNQKQLNEWEAVNILQAETWLFTHTDHGDFLTLDFAKLLATSSPF